MPALSRAITASVLLLVAGMSPLLVVAPSADAQQLLQLAVSETPVVQTMVVPKSIDATGATDVTTQLVSFFKTVPPDTVVRFPQNGLYRIEGTVRLVDLQRVAINGNNSLLYATTTGDRTRSQLEIVGGHDISVANLRIKGANPDGGVNGIYDATLEAQHGVNVLGPERVRLNNLTITDVYGDFVYLGDDPRFHNVNYRHPASDVRIVDNTFARNGRQGISFRKAVRVVVRNNSIDDVRRATFDFEPNGSLDLVSDVWIRDNTIGTGRLNFIAAAGTSTVKNVRVVGNHSTVKALNAYILDRDGALRANFSFVNNYSTRPWGSSLAGAVTAYGVQGISYTDNTQVMQPNRDMAGLRTYRSCGVRSYRNILENGVQLVTDGYVCLDSPAVTAPAWAAAVIPPQPR